MKSPEIYDVIDLKDIPPEELEYCKQKLNADLFERVNRLEREELKLFDIHKKWLAKINIEPGVIEAIEERMAMDKKFLSEVIKKNVTSDVRKVFEAKVNFWHELLIYEKGSLIPISSFDIIQQRMKVISLFDQIDRLKNILSGLDNS